MERHRNRHAGKARQGRGHHAIDGTISVVNRGDASVRGCAVGVMVVGGTRTAMRSKADLGTVSAGQTRRVKVATMNGIPNPDTAAVTCSN